MNSTVLISVIIPVYNVEKYLKKCINSVINQTYSNLEILLIDDGSSDSSGEICDTYKALDSRIRVIHQKNQGLSAARNTGLNIMCGDYVTLIDSDDYVQNDYIEYLYNLVKSTGASMSVTQPILFKDGRDIINKEEDTRDGVRILYNSYNCMKDFLQCNNIGTVAWGKLYKRDLFEVIRYPVGKYHEDVFTTYLLVDQCTSIAIGNKKKYYYRQRDGSILHSSFSMRHLDIIEGKLRIYRYINKKYPCLNSSAEQGIIYATNQCIMRLVGNKTVEDNIIKYLQSLYRRHLFSYLKGHSKFIAKLFACICYINVKIVLRIGSKFLGLMEFNHDRKG